MSVLCPLHCIEFMSEIPSCKCFARVGKVRECERFSQGIVRMLRKPPISSPRNQNLQARDWHGIARCIVHRTWDLNRLRYFESRKDSVICRGKMKLVTRKRARSGG